MAITLRDQTFARTINMFQRQAGTAVGGYGVGGPTRAGFIGADMKIDTGSIDLTVKNLDVYMRAIYYRALTVLGTVVADILAEAQPRVPYYEGGDRGLASTGRLRESGKAFTTINGGNHVLVGQGQRDGSIKASTGKLRPQLVRGRVGRLVGYVWYHRINNKGQDIALWTHESLLPEEEYTGEEHHPGYSYARTPGTGPKYLELVWVEHRAKYMRTIQKAMAGIPQEIRKLRRTIKKAKGVYDIDRVELVRGKIAEVGYFESALR